MRKHTHWMALVACLIALPSVAAADEEIDEAKKHFFAGEALYSADRFPEAIDEFMAANKIRSHPAFLYNIGVTYEAMGKLEKAVEWLEKYREDTEKDEEKLRVGKKIAALKREIGEFPASSPSSGPSSAPVRPRKKSKTKKVMEVFTTPAGASFWLGKKEGDPITVTPYSIEVDGGEYIFTVELEGHAPATRKVNIDKPWQTYDITLRPLDAVGFVTILTDQPGSKIYVDSRDAGVIGRTPYKDWMPIGTHHIWVEKEGYETVEADIAIGSGETPTFDYEMKIAHYGRLEVLSEDIGATIEVSGKVIATTPVPSPAPRVDTGTHAVKIKAKGKKAWKTTVLIENGKTLTLRASLAKNRSYVGPIVGGAFAVGFATTGLVFALRAKAKLSAISDAADAGKLVDADDRRNVNARIDAIVADSAFGLAVITGLVTVISLVRDKTPPSTGKIISSKFSAAPLPGGGGLVTFSGGF